MFPDSAIARTFSAGKTKATHLTKEFVILTRLYDEATLQVVTRLMEMPECNVGNAENLYEKLSEALRAAQVPVEDILVGIYTHFDKRLIKRILGFLIPARAIMGVPLKEVENGEGHQLADEELFIGAETKGIHGKDGAPCIS
ncbi:hypothetical protein XENOCAPTIV_029374 [Xenoophorus captivus]|uniref:Uncharacterized protein n=1 Tax=Xenoophorus captivus TaxID=1517983 RepID=A0ABV0QF59_9TELE